MSKHTPGPWKVISDAAAKQVEVFEIAEISHFRVIPDRKDTWANTGDAESDARLIAASPELLEQLQKFVDEYKQLPHSLGYEYTHLPDAIAAIAKATGEQDE